MDLLLLDQQGKGLSHRQESDIRERILELCEGIPGVECWYGGIHSRTTGAEAQRAPLPSRPYGHATLNRTEGYVSLNQKYLLHGQQDQC